MYGFKGPLNIESYLRLKKKIIIEKQEATSLYYFTFNIKERSFSYRPDIDSPEIKNIHRGRDLLGFEDILSDEDMKLCEWKFGFKIQTSFRDYVLYAEKKEIYKKWMRVLNFVFNKIDILRPNAIINYDLDNTSCNDYTLNHNEDINQDIKDLEEKYDILYPNKEESQPTFTKPYIRKRIINEPKKENSIDIVQPSEKQELDDSLSFPIKQSNIEYGSHIIYEPNITPSKNYSSQEINNIYTNIPEKDNDDIITTDPLNFSQSDKGFDLNHLSVYKQSDLPTEKPSMTIAYIPKHVKSFSIQHTELDFTEPNTENDKQVITQDNTYTIAPKPYDIHSLHIKQNSNKDFTVNIEGLHYGRILNQKKVYTVDERRFLNHKNINNISDNSTSQNNVTNINDKTIFSSLSMNNGNNNIDRISILQDKIIRELDEDSVYIGKEKKEKKFTNKEESKNIGESQIIVDSIKKEKKKCDGMHMLVEATYKTNESTFIRDKLHLARNELNGDKNVYERMIEKKERGIGKEIEFVSENKEEEEIKENTYGCELEEDWN